MDLNLIFLSIIEGVTEFLPISSTAHLIIASKFLNVDLIDSNIKFYLLAIQFGALLAGIFLFGKRILSDKNLFINILISFIPTAILGFALYKLFKKLIEGNMILLSVALFIGGVVFIFLEKVYIKKYTPTEHESFGKNEITILDAFLIGIAQAIAIIPGVSRSGVTIIAGILRGIKKTTIIEYTFLLAIPTLGSAVFYDAYKSSEIINLSDSLSSLGIGITISFVSGLLTLYIINKYLTKISLTSFGIYRILLSFIIITSIYL